MTQTPSQNPSLLWSHSIEAIAFDMDGLMVNTEDLYTIVGQRILQRRGKDFTPELKKEMMGLPAPGAFQVMIDWHRLSDSPAQLQTETEEVFTGLLDSRLEALPGLFELLDWAEQQALPKCVATSSSHQFARKVLSGIEVLDRFQFVITAEDVPHGKPAPDIYLAAAGKLGVEPQNMLVLEDSQHGSTAGVASGACTVAVPGDHSRDHDFSRVCFIAHSLQDPTIFRILDSSNNSNH